MAESHPRRNRLAAETSPYLLQHADNPVDWYPWGSAALSRAVEERRPILLSIGYSACHWCHVMAHESFEDATTAETMNRLFVNIKVDREERPDLDRIYQTAHQLLARRPGGWPLTVFLSPEQVPFFSGTYFPREPRHGLPGFRDLLGQVAEAWRNQPEAIDNQNEALQKALHEIANAPAGDETLDERPLGEARKTLGGAFDERFGGFGSAPKFPQPSVLHRLLRHYARGERLGQPDRQALHMASVTLRRMILGGIYDQVGGGFARYSVDDYWMIPHFEKMLYDNALLLGLATDVWRITGDALYARAARETARWLMREMRHPDGGFYAALDADSEGAEGTFYLWSPNEIRDALPADQAELVILRFGLDERPNFEGRWHLHVHMSFSELAKRLRCPRETVVSRWQQAQKRLLEIRDKRPRPHRDDKILAGWNGLAARGLARAGRYLDEPDLIDASAQCLEFLRRHNWSAGRLRASWKDGRADLAAYLDDYAFVLNALLEQLEARWDDRWLDWAGEIADLIVERFEDREHGGFFFTTDDHEALIQRPRSFGDDALPAGNGVAALALARLGHLLGESRYIEASTRALKAGAPAMQQLPHGHCSLLDALEEYLEPPETILIRPQATDSPAAWRHAASSGYAPNRQVFLLPSGNGERRLGATTLTGQGAWVCRGTRCLPRLDSAAALGDRLAAGDDG